MIRKEIRSSFGNQRWHEGTCAKSSAWNIAENDAFFAESLRKALPTHKRRHIPLGPDQDLEKELAQYLDFMFLDWGARIVSSEIGLWVEVECGNIRLRAMRERDFLVFFMSPRDIEDWNCPDVIISAVTGENHTSIMTDRTSLPCLARALEPRMAKLQNALSNLNLSTTQHAIGTVRQAAEERFRTNPQTIGDLNRLQD